MKTKDGGANKYRIVAKNVNTRCIPTVFVETVLLRKDVGCALY